MKFCLSIDDVTLALVHRVSEYESKREGEHFTIARTIRKAIREYYNSLGINDVQVAEKKLMEKG
jgi:hypothetical protein